MSAVALNVKCEKCVEMFGPQNIGMLVLKNFVRFL